MTSNSTQIEIANISDFDKGKKTNLCRSKSLKLMTLSKLRSCSVQVIGGL